MSTIARDAAQDAAAGRAASAGVKDIQEDLEALRADVARLTAQIGDLLAANGGGAWQKAKTSLEGAISDAEAKRQEAVDAVRAVGDNVVEAIDKSLEKRPYTTLAIAAGLGFLFGATWRR